VRFEEASQELPVGLRIVDNEYGALRGDIRAGLGRCFGPSAVSALAGTQFNGKESLHVFHEILRMDRLGDVSVKTCVQQPFTVADHSQRGDCDQRHCSERWFSLEPPHHLKTVGFGKLHVAHDQIRTLPLCYFQALQSVHGREGLVPVGGKQVHHKLQVGRIVFNHQNSR
jgi:hypothetical protein